MNDDAETATGIGAPVPRVEDFRLLTGAGRFSDDMGRDNQLYAVMARAPILAGSFMDYAAPPAVINAIVDALSEFGVRHLDMPATPERIWRAINSA